jgi:hypothetical protein
MYTQEEFKKKVAKWLEDEGYSTQGTWLISGQDTNDNSVWLSVSIQQSIILNSDNLKETFEVSTTTLDEEESIRLAVINLNRFFVEKLDKMFEEIII